MFDDKFKLQIGQVCQDFDISKLSLFGSQARGEANTHSDVDLLVEFKQNPGLIGFVKTKHAFEKIFNRKVDLVTQRGLSKYIAPYIKPDLTTLYG